MKDIKGETVFNFMNWFRRGNKIEIDDKLFEEITTFFSTVTDEIEYYENKNKVQNGINHLTLSTYLSTGGKLIPNVLDKINRLKRLYLEDDYEERFKGRVTIERRMHMMIRKHTKEVLETIGVL